MQDAHNVGGPPIPLQVQATAKVVGCHIENDPTARGDDIAHRVSDATFQAAQGQFGVQGLTELTNLMGYYALLAFNANAFAIDLPAQRSEPVLPV